MKVLGHFLLWQLHLAKAWTFYSEAECKALERYAAGKKRLVEIGCWQGVNTSRLRRRMSPEGILYAVDPYPKGRLGFSAPRIIAQKEVSKVGNGKVKWLVMTDLEAAIFVGQKREEPFDFIFSDSLNTYEGFKACWEAWSPLIAPGGIYVLANSHSTAARNIENAGSVQFTRDSILKDERFALLEIVDSFTVLRRQP